MFAFLIRAQFSQWKHEHSALHWSALRTPTSQTMSSIVIHSSLQAIGGLKTDYPFVANIIHKMNQLASNGCDIHLCWVLGHADIRGNKCADRAANKALNCNVEPCQNTTLT